MGQYNTKIRRLAMASNEHPRRYPHDPNLFKVSLSQHQRNALALYLPQRYSFQPCKTTHIPDEESMRSEPIKITKKKLNKDLKDPDYSASYVAPLKDLPIVKTESLQAIPGGPFYDCYLILKRLKKSMFAWPFKIPVDPKALGIPEYLNIVQEPMDLRTMEENLRKEEYKHPAEFHRDMYKIFTNSYKFNQKHSDVFAATVEFEEEYLRLVKEAKQGKLACQDKKSAKMDTPPQEEPPLSVKEEVRSMEHKPRPYIKRDKTDKLMVNEDKSKEKDKHHEHFLMREKTVEKDVRVQDRADKIKDKEREKQKRQEKKLEKQRKLERERIKIEQNSQPEYKPVDLFRNFQERQEDQLQRSASDCHYDAHRDERQEYSHSNDPNKHRGKHTQQGKIRKHKDKNDISQTLKEIKELKEVNQFENEKNAIVTNIQKRLTELLKRLNDCQLPRSKGKAAPNKLPEQEPVNYNNFTTVSAAQKKKLGERIGLLNECELRNVVEICFRHKRNKARDESGQYDIDLERLEPKVLKELSNFVASRTKWVRKNSKRDLSQRNISQAEEMEEEIQNDPSFFDQQAHLDNVDNHLRTIQLGNDQNIFDNNLLDDDREVFAHDIYQQPNFNFTQKDLMEIDNNSEEQSYQPHEDDDDELKF